MAILERVKAAREKQAEPDTGAAFASALDAMNTQRLQHEALGNIGKLGLTALGVGVAGRGAIGLLNTIRRNREKETRSGPAELSMPIPVDPTKLANFLAGDSASTVGGIPWYGPAMMGVGMGGLGLGWKGMDALLASRQRSETEGELTKSREDFRKALLAQYDQPQNVAVGKKAASDTMEKVGQALDAVFEKLTSVLEQHAGDAPRQKQALFGIDAGNLSGQAAGGYGMYAGLSGLLTGALVYDKMQKRSQRAVIAKALQRRQRRRFMQSPTEIYATPEPVAAETE